MMSLLSWITFFPCLGAIALFFVPSTKPKIAQAFGVATALATFLLSLVLLFNFEMVPGYQWVERHVWLMTYGIEYHMGVDGLSLPLVLLTTLLTLISLISSSHSITERKKEFIFSILVLETAMLGTFFSLDLFFFYIFWEVMLIPMFLLIGVFGGPRRIYATFKFFLYTAVGSLLMLVSLIALYVLHYHQTGILTTSIDQVLGTHVPMPLQLWMFLGFFIAFAIKIPLFPFHTWLPDAHVEAPTAGSVLLAGVLLKMGGYGLLRFAIPFFPEAAQVLAPSIAVLAVIGIVYGALMCFRQEDIKKMVAYSSVSHMGFVVLGIFSLQQAAMAGAVFQMIAHGLTTGALFLLVGMIYDRRHSRLIADFGGIAPQMPKYTILFFIVTMGSIGLPGLCGFIGEFLILTGAFQAEIFRDLAYLYVGFAVVGVVLGAAYMLRLFERVFLGTDPHGQSISDVSTREGLYTIALVALIFWFGIQPNAVLRFIDLVSYATPHHLAGQP